MLLYPVKVESFAAELDEETGVDDMMTSINSNNLR
jgi:hypothetical protein